MKLTRSLALSGVALAGAVPGYFLLGRPSPEAAPSPVRVPPLAESEAAVLGARDPGTQGDGRLPLEPRARPRGDPTEEAAAWLSCLSGDSALLRECLRTRLPDFVEPGVLAEALCDPGIRTRRQAAIVLLSEALRRMDPAQAWDYLDEVVACCREGGEGSGTYASAMLELQRTDPAWFEALRAAWTPQVMFAPGRTRVACQVAKELARTDETIRTWLEDGARGAYGGDAAQLDQAIASATALQTGAEAKLSFLVSVYRSPTLPDGPSTGAMLVSQLLMHQHWPQGDPARALALVLEILHDPRFEVAAANYIAESFRAGSSQVVSSDLWSRVRARVDQLAR